MIVDTDILIWNLRGNDKAADFLDQLPGFRISAVTWMELNQGARDKQEQRLMRQSLRFWNAEIQPINEEISARAMFWIEQFSLSHGLRMADALIAGTAAWLGQPLATANDRHYQFIDGIELKKFRP